MLRKMATFRRSGTNFMFQCLVSINNGHVDGVRLSLHCGHKRANCASLRSYKHAEPVTLTWKLLIRPPDLSGDPTSSHLVTKQEKLAKEINFCQY
jgi:hypothetical protein